MGKSRRRTNWIFTIISVLLIIGTLVFSYINYNNYNKNLKIKEELTLELKNKTEELDKVKQSKEEISKKIENLDNLEELTKEKINNVYKLSRELEIKINNKETDKKIAYLTFDDGPYYLSRSFLKLFREKNVKVTFFTTNVNGTKCYDNSKVNCQENYALYAKDHHTIANHTYTHGIWKGIYSSVSNFETVVKKQENLVKEKTGLTTNIFRFPGGSSQPNYSVKGIASKLRSKLYSMGYGYVDWTANDGDGKGLSSTTEGWNTLMSTTKDNIEVVLFHDYCNATYNLMSKYIDWLRNNNYVILPLYYESQMVIKEG